VKAALKEQANAFVNMAGKCQTIFTAQRAVAEVIPVQNDDGTLLSNKNGKFAVDLASKSVCELYTYILQAKNNFAYRISLKLLLFKNTLHVTELAA